MLDKNLYKDTFSVLKASEDTLSEVLKMTTHRKRITSKALLIAATVAILTIALVGTAFAVNMFGLRDLMIPHPDHIFSFDEFQGTEEQFKAMSPDGTLDDFAIPMGEMVLAGFAGSPEFEAAVEWLNRDRTIYIDGVGVRWDQEADIFVNAETGTFFAEGIMTVENQETLDSIPPEYLEGYVVRLCERDDIPEVYQWHGASSWADVDKINEIIERHGLVLYGALFDYYNTNRSWEEFQASVANGSIIDNSGNNFTLYPGYRWESGTFQFDAQYGDIWFSLRSSRKGTFDTVMLTNMDMNAFSDEWAFENQHGTTLILVPGVNMSFIIADTGTAFIIVSIHAGTESRVDWEGATLRLTRSELEHFADLIDFGQLK
ncbi:MAG: hypothetical protein FWD99_06835 [Oscillospiraceae bacterium]|nr:hypothetical protein [Oscillospiraceae bacterium]